MNASIPWYQRKPSATSLTIIFAAALLLRAATFQFFIKDHEYYRQPDSNDYNVCALLVAYIKSMTIPGGDPIIWRTPGYPAFLAPFYSWQGTPSLTFRDMAPAQRAAIWVQIIRSLIPIILLYLAMLLSGSWPIAWIMAIISVIHVGFVLATTYLLTDALASVFFYLFLLALYGVWLRAGEFEYPFGQTLRQAQGERKGEPFVLSLSKHTNVKLILAGLALAGYTWMRPMGKFVGIFTIFFIRMIPATTIWHRLQKAVTFGASFFLPLLPWYIRNYQLTGKWFFCPMSGEYLRVFCAPKLVRRVTGATYEQCMGFLAQDLGRHMSVMMQQNPAVKPLIHLIAGSVAYPWIKQYPFEFLYDWMVQVFKTSFDLYSYQLVAIARNAYMCDPLEELLGEKIAAILYAGELPVWMRVIGWIEFIAVCAMWIGIFAGIFQYILRPLFYYFTKTTRPSAHIAHNGRAHPHQTPVWLLTIPMIGVILVQTGGFGYARLRLPIEPLMIILALMWYEQFVMKKNNI